MSEDHPSTSAEFRPIEGWSDYRIDADGILWRMKSGRWRQIMGSVQAAGHIKVALADGNGHRTNRYIHRLVLEAFRGPCPDGMECRHLDGNPQNNRLDNLRWGTRTENMADAIRHGTTNRGTRTNFAKLTDDDVIAIRELRRRGVHLKVIAAQFGIRPEHVWHIAVGRSWKHLPV